MGSKLRFALHSRKENVMSSIKPLWLVGLCILEIALCAIPLVCQKSQPPATAPSTAESSGEETPAPAPDKPAAESAAEPAEDEATSEEAEEAPTKK